MDGLMGAGEVRPEMRGGCLWVIDVSEKTKDGRD